MQRPSYLIAAAATAALAAAALASHPKFSNIGAAVVKATQRTVDGYTFDVPSGGENAVPTILVWSDNKVSYSRAQQGKMPLRFNVETAQVCLGSEWDQYRLPHVYIGDRHWPGPADGKPILRQEGHTYHASLEVQLNRVEFAPGFSRAQAVHGGAPLRWVCTRSGSGLYASDMAIRACRILHLWPVAGQLGRFVAVVPPAAHIG